MSNTIVTMTPVAASVPFDNVSSGLPATDTQSAIEELKKGYNLLSSANSSTIVKYTTNNNDVLISQMTLSPASGTHVVDFNCQYSSTVSSVTTQVAADLSAAIASIKALTVTVTTHGPSFGLITGETLTAGVYAIVGAGTLLTSIILDGQNNPNALFVFKFTGALSSGASTSMSLINGANASNVFFVADGAVSLGASCTMKGSFFSDGAAVAIGAGCSINGRASTTGGAVSLDSSIVTTPSISTVITLGTLDTFALFTSHGAVANTASSTITGDIGTNGGAVSGFGTSTVNGTIYLPVASTSTITFSIFANGVLVANSQRTITRTVDVAADCISLRTFTTIVAGQSLEVRIKVGIGTVTVGNKILTSLRIGL